MAAVDSAHPAARLHRPHQSRAALAGWILLASVMCGVGIYLVFYFITFFDWVDFLGVPLVVLGCLIFFATWSGPETAD